MIKLALASVVIALSASGCVSDRQSSVSPHEHAKAVALEYLTRHHVPLPTGYTIEAEDGEYGSEIAPPRLTYNVVVSVSRRGKAKLIYQLFVDPRTWRVELFSDPRKSIPSDI
jgi:hypothetical protein